MNEQLQKELATWLAQFRDAANQGAQFAITQAPLLVQEKIAYGRAIYTALAILMIVSFVVLIISATKALKQDGENVTTNVFAVTSALLFVPCLFMSDVIIPSFFMVWFAPRLFVIEWLSELIKK